MIEAQSMQKFVDDYAFDHAMRCSSRVAERNLLPAADATDGARAAAFREDFDVVGLVGSRREADASRFLNFFNGRFYQVQVRCGF